MQLEQAIAEAQGQHRRLKEQATNVIASQKQAEIRLNGKMAELEKLNANARQALIMAADAEKAGNADKAAQYTSAAETIANQLIQVEKDVESLKTMVLESTQAADQAKAAVQQNSRLLQQKIAEKSKLLSQLEQAKMQEEMNTAMSQLSETVGDDVPTLNEVGRRSRPATPRPRRRPSSTRRRSSHACSRSSRRPPTSRPRAGSPSCAPSSASTAERRHATGRRRRPTGLTGRSLGRRVTSGRQQDEVVAVDRPRAPCRRAGRGCACRPPAADRAASTNTMPRANTAPSVPRTSTVSPSPKRPTHVGDAGRQQARRPLGQRPPCAVVDHDRAGDPAANAIQSLRAGSRRSWASNMVPTTSPPTASTSGPFAGGVGDHGPDARPRRDPRRGELARHAAAPAPAAAGAGPDREQRIVGRDVARRAAASASMRGSAV